MAGSSRYTVVLDACVLYPAPVRDLLLSLAHQGMYHARWSPTINDEWIRNLLANRPDLKADQLHKTVKKMAATIPDCMITGYSRFVPTIELPDPDDRHVVAALKESTAKCATIANHIGQMRLAANRWLVE